MTARNDLLPSIALLALLLGACSTPAPQPQGQLFPLPTVKSTSAPLPSLQPPTPTSNPSPTPKILALSPITSSNAQYIERLFTFQLYQSSYSHASLAISPDKTVLAAASPGGQLSVVEMEWTGEGRLHRPSQIPVLPPSLSRVTALVFSPQGGLLAVSTIRDDVHILDSSTREILKTFKPSSPPIYTPNSLAFADDGASLAVSTMSGTQGFIELWDLASTTQKVVLDTQPGWGPPCSLAASPDGTLIAAGYCRYSQNFQAWSGFFPYRPLPAVSGIEGDFTCGHGCENQNIVFFSPDNTTLASATSWPRVPLIDITTGRLRFILTTIRTIEDGFTIPWPVNGVAFNADGTVVAIAALNELQVRDSGDGTFLWHAETTFEPSFVAIAMSADGRLLATLDSKGQLDLWGVPQP